MSKSNFQKFIQKNEKGAKLKESIRQEKKKQRQETKEYFAQQKSKRKGGEIPEPSSAAGRTADELITKRGGRSKAPGRNINAKGRNLHPNTSRKSSSANDRHNTTGENTRQAAPDKRTTSTIRDNTSGAKNRTDTQRNIAGINNRQTTRASKGKANTQHASDIKRPATIRPATSRVKDAFNTRHSASDKKSTARVQNNAPLTKNTENIRHSTPGSKNTKTKNSPRDTDALKPAINQPPASEKNPGSMPLNKYVAHAGVCSRRDAAALVRSGKVSVNGQAINEPGFKVNPTDDIRVQGKKINANKNLVYILLNKPKDHITTTDDPQGRKTVMDIVRNATDERVYPVGRLDRNTTGVLILTNDGELAQKLSHPSYEVRKIYEVTLDKPLIKKDFDELLNGITLEDGFIAPDSLAYADAKDKSIIGIEIHSGKNRIVRRMFEKLGYDVRNLDRVMYANLTKKNVERGKWRFLQDKEVRLLKFMNASYGRKK